FPSTFIGVLGPEGPSSDPSCFGGVDACLDGFSAVGSRRPNEKPLQDSYSTPTGQMKIHSSCGGEGMRCSY
ncbi:unnamed protein product, partial [Musa acuminata var. zebrina]